LVVVVFVVTVFEFFTHGNEIDDLPLSTKAPPPTMMTARMIKRMRVVGVIGVGV
jgi:hypothetical protein